MDSTPVLHQGWGYGLMIGLGFLFAVLMIIITWALKRYNYELQTSEMFTTAGRSLKSGLVHAQQSGDWTIIAASVFLFPIGVVVYTLFGGIKATFITDYINGLVILIIIFVFAFAVYSTNDILGSPGRMWEILTDLAAERPLSGNAGGSYLTMRSQGGVEFFIINLCGNFGTVFLDNGYYNKAIAASPVDALPGYVMGGVSWFAVPWLTATTMGLAGLALERYDIWPSFPNRMPAADVDAGLVLPTVAVALLGKGGAVATLILAFMAIMSTYSSELIAISSICTYDIYKTYINPAATGKQLMRINYIGMAAFALVMAGLATGFNYIGISMGYLYLMMGVIISSAVLPATLTLLWSGQSWAAATFSPIIGFVLSMTAWLVTTKIQYGELSVETTGANTPMLAGNLTSLLSPVVCIPLLTFIPPFKHQKYDWQSMLNIRKGDDHEIVDATNVDLENMTERPHAVDSNIDERVKLDRAAKIARWLTVGVTLVLLILWPMPLYGSGYVFSKQRNFLKFWKRQSLLIADKPIHGIFLPPRNPMEKRSLEGTRKRKEEVIRLRVVPAGMIVIGRLIHHKTMGDV
ncbi:putative urea active transporter 1 [Colletotrichum sp. SAR 10_76]|nr:putative urea active transporter 1 [Colletotrichum sp. SAR 10_76]